MLVNEFYPVTTTISNPYNVFLTGIALNISVPNNLKNKGKWIFIFFLFKENVGSFQFENNFNKNFEQYFKFYKDL